MRIQMNLSESDKVDSSTVIITNVGNCARCQQNHEQVTFYKFINNPIRDTDGTIWNYWRLCPNTQEPILLKVIEKDEPIKP